MTADNVPQDQSLAAVLGARAQRSTSARLALDVAGGAAVAAAAIMMRPKGWVALLAAALCFLLFGAWAATAQRLQRPDVAMDNTLERSAPPASQKPFWLLLHTASALAGLSAFVLLLFATLGLALGKIIS